MARYAFRILNVFAPTTFEGNPLCVFEDASGLTEQTMLLLTRQFNLSETAFVFPATSEQHRAGVTAGVRVFTPGHEMAFAGHPALGTAQVVRAVHGTGTQMTLRFKAGDVALSAPDPHEPDLWTLAPPLAHAPRSWAPAVAPAAIAQMLGLNEQDLADAPAWMDTGSDHLLVPVRTADALSRASFDSTRLMQWPVSSLGRRTAYVFCVNEDSGSHMEIGARYFFIRDGAMVEDPGTGSACANLGAWLAHARNRLNLTANVTQGEKMNRLCRLVLGVDASGGIRVGGRVIELGTGQVDI